MTTYNGERFLREQIDLILNQAICICMKRGADYIALSDQDDIRIPNHLDVLLKTLNSKEGPAYEDVCSIDGNNNGYSKLSERLNLDMEKLSVLDKLKSAFIL